MKNLVKVLAIIAIAAAIGLSMTACSEDFLHPRLPGDIFIRPSSATTGTTLTATYTGTKTVHYQWRRGNTNLGTARTQRADAAGSYTVTVSHAGYSSKTSAPVTVTAGNPQLIGTWINDTTNNIRVRISSSQFEHSNNGGSSWQGGSYTVTGTNNGIINIAGISITYTLSGGKLLLASSSLTYLNGTYTKQ